MNFRYPTIFFTAFIILVLSGLNFPALAQEGDSSALQQEVETTTIPPPEEEGPAEVDVTGDTEPIGIVAEICITGEIVTSKGAVLRQMTFSIGDEISQRDLDITKRRLLGFNGIYWNADISWEETEEPGHIRISIDLRARRTWFISPSIAGGLIGDRNFLGTADTLSLGVFIGEGDYYYSVGWRDPQFLGGHNTMNADFHVLDTSASIRTDDIFSTGEVYDLDRTGVSLYYGTTWDENISVGLGYKWDDVATQKRGDPYANFGTDNYFYYSGRDITPGHVGVLSLNIHRGNLNSFYFPTAGYYWGTKHEFSHELTGSDFEFTRHTISGSYFYDLHENRNAFAARMLYSMVNGDPPDYELIPFDWQVRGYDGGLHRGKSMFVMNYEYRLIAEKDIFQVVLFSDFGQCWDDVNLDFGDLEYGYGIGIRIYAKYFIPYNLLFRVDYGFGAYGERLMYGFGQFF